MGSEASVGHNGVLTAVVWPSRCWGGPTPLPAPEVGGWVRFGVLDVGREWLPQPVSIRQHRP